MEYSAKKMLRLENKKKKMVALAMIGDLNDADSLKIMDAKKLKTERDVKDKLTDGTLKTGKHNGFFQEKIAFVSESKRKRQEGKDKTSNVENEKQLKLEKTDCGKPLLPAKSPELAELRRKLRIRKRKLTSIPRLNLNAVGEQAVFRAGQESSVPLFLSDVQDLIVFYLTGNTFHNPRWCQVEKVSRVSHLSVLIVEGVSSYAYSNAESQLPCLAASDAVLEVVLPAAYGGDLAEELAHVPISPAQRRWLLETHGSVDGVLHTYKHLKYKMLRAMFPIKASAERGAGLPEGDRFSRTDLILDLRQLVEENYPLPLEGALKKKYRDYVISKDQYTDVTCRSPLFAVDCEMCLTRNGMELTRVSVVDEALTLVYDALVKPDLPIIDYLTKYSGITAEQMEGVQTRLADVQKALQCLLPPDAILVGQSLNCDLNALQMMHPYVIDTSVIFNITGTRGRKSKLATLAREFLGERIQEGTGHCSVEDSTTCIKLVKLKLSHSAEFGDAVQVGRDEATVHQATAALEAAGGSVATTVTCPQITEGLAHCAVEAGRLVAVVGGEAAVNGYIAGCVSKKSQVTSAVENNAEAAVARAVALAPRHDTVLVHLNAPDNVAVVDGWTQTLWNALPPCGMLVVLLGGALPAATGLCLIRVNKNTS